MSKSLARTGCSKKARCADLTIRHAKAAPLAAFLPRDDDTWIKKNSDIITFQCSQFCILKNTYSACFHGNLHMQSNDDIINCCSLKNDKHKF